ncbi:ABC transporter ATP-binding protein [Desertimonas flava]|uniref:ABC transporter ATP-binding protein n=1 Tax=Desertimonas flava TaxID=2064846 RepID=UPI000E35546C|nr:ABC transporter ATP-binding protein [Desertimonas flava]
MTAAVDADTTPLLSVRDLRVRFGTKRGVARVVNGISYDVAAGETVAIVGESGSGKSVGVMALMGLVKQPPGRVEGSARFEGAELIGATEAELRMRRGNRMAMIFQDPMTSLNPVRSIGYQVGESLRVHQGLSKRAALDRAGELLDLVGIPSPRQRLREYPHQFSGGMRQRVMIAMGLATDPSLLIADEPTTALDVTTQAQIVELVGDLQARLGMAVVWITHDLGVVARIAHRVLVMYAGRIVESGTVDDVLADPRHPYSIGLLESLPKPGVERPERLFSIPGLPPDPVHLPAGCAFWERCSFRLDDAERDTVPELREVSPGHAVACLYDVARPRS